MGIDFSAIGYSHRNEGSRDMILSHLELEDFRGFRDTRIDFDQRLTVLVGANGAGKTSVLDAIAIMLDQYAARLLDQRMSAKRLVASDARLGSPDTYLSLGVCDEGQNISWALRKQGMKQRLLRPAGSELAGLNQYIRDIAERGLGQEDFLNSATLPVYYDQRRGLAEVPQRKRAAAKHSARNAFEESRSKSGLDLRSFVYWFEERESEELREQRRNRRYEDPQLAAVRKAIKDATDLSDLSYRPIPPRGLIVHKGKVELRVDQLSTGERVFLAMAGDLARRLAMLGSESKKAQPGCAVVLIDEVELHLHPRWQRTILPWMLRAFPTCQFVVTTHSPQVIGDIEADRIRVLEFSPKGNKVRRVSASQGRDSNFLLLNVFGADERSPKSKRVLEAFERALKAGDLETAALELERAEAKIEGSASELAIARARLQRRQAASI